MLVVMMMVMMIGTERWLWGRPGAKEVTIWTESCPFSSSCRRGGAGCCCCGSIGLWDDRGANDSGLDPLQCGSGIAPKCKLGCLDCSFPDGESWSCRFDRNGGAWGGTGIGLVVGTEARLGCGMLMICGIGGGCWDWGGSDGIGKWIRDTSLVNCIGLWNGGGNCTNIGFRT